MDRCWSAPPSSSTRTDQTSAQNAQARPRPGRRMRRARRPGRRAAPSVRSSGRRPTSRWPGRISADLQLNLQPGMTMPGRVVFDATTRAAPTDLTTVRVTLRPVGQQTLDVGPLPPAEVDASGQFTVTGVAPGRYSLRANVGAPAAGRGRRANAAGAGRGAGAGRRGGAGSTLDAGVGRRQRPGHAGLPARRRAERESSPAP